VSNAALASNFGASADSFRAAVAFYPVYCGYLVPHSADARKPLLILIGENDDWANPNTCAHATQAGRQNGQPVTLQTYPGALHASDIAERPIVIRGHHWRPTQRPPMQRARR
jgi:dienelactone hydrolase